MINIRVNIRNVLETSMTVKQLTIVLILVWECHEGQRWKYRVQIEISLLGYELLPNVNLKFGSDLVDNKNCTQTK